jgi:heat shock protein HslJ
MATDDLSGSRWALEYINLDGVSHMVLGENPPEITFTDGEFTTSDGVNRGGGAYSVGEQTFSAGPVASTRATYPRPRLAEHRFFEHLESTGSWIRHGDKLHLAFLDPISGEGELVLELLEESGRSA